MMLSMRVAVSRRRVSSWRAEKWLQTEMEKDWSPKDRMSYAILNNNLKVWAKMTMERPLVKFSFIK